MRIPGLLLLAAALLVLPAGAAGQPDEPININTADVDELTELPRVGEVTAARIVAWREENGPFSRIEELMNVPGIGERTFERIRPHVTVGMERRRPRRHGGIARNAHVPVVREAPAGSAALP